MSSLKWLAATSCWHGAALRSSGGGLTLPVLPSLTASACLGPSWMAAWHFLQVFPHYLLHSHHADGKSCSLFWTPGALKQAALPSMSAHAHRALDY